METLIKKYQFALIDLASALIDLLNAIIAIIVPFWMYNKEGQHNHFFSQNSVINCSCLE